MGYRVIDMLVDHFYELPQKPVTRKAGRSELEGLLREPLPEGGMHYQGLLDQVKQDVLDNIMHLDHPRFFAFVPGPSNFVGVMADALASGFNVYAGTWLEGSGPAEIELVTVDWLRAACDLPERAGGLFVSGGSMANLTALAVARHVRLGDRLEGAVVYCSDQTHSSIDRALWVLGFGAGQLRKIESDPHFRLNLTALRRAIEADRAAGLEPFCIIANAGTTNTGAVDPLPDLASLCQAEDLWLHVDGAYGAAAVLCERGKELLRGLGQADSLALDPHKWLFQPYEIGCVLVRDRRWLRKTFQILPEYLTDIQGVRGEVSFCDYGIQLTRSFRALKLWMSLKFFGRSAFERALTRGFELAEMAEAVVGEMDDWEVITPAEMAIVTFRYAPAQVPCDRLNRVNRELVRSMIGDGHALLTSTVLNEMVVLRMCCINPRTSENEVRDTLARLDQMGRELE
jgi:glutamate/tyrosine decarboxylase-like PLP-dependent enzyme